MTNDLTIGVIGCGGMTHAHLNGMKALQEAGFGDFRVTACCDVVEEAAQRFAAEAEELLGQRPAVYTDWQAMLAGESDLDAVDISVVHREHHPLALGALQAGKHVFIEKPLAITMRAARLILDEAQCSDRVLMVAENYRRDPSWRAMRWALQDGRIGDIRLVFWIDLFERLWHWGWRDSRQDAGGGWMLDGGVHTADLLLFLAGRIESVCGLGRTYYPLRHGTHGNADLSLPGVPVDVEDTTLSLLNFASGASGSWLLATCAPGRQHNAHLIYGSEGCLETGVGLSLRGSEVSQDQLISEYMASLSAEEKERWFPRGVTNSVATEIAEFVRACREGGPVETGAREGYEAMAVCFAIYESEALGRPVTVAEVEDLQVEEYQADINKALGL